MKSNSSSGIPSNSEENESKMVILSQCFKGGSGKSTMAVNIAGAFASRGKKSVIIDCDSQCNSSTYFGQTIPPAEVFEAEEYHSMSFGEEGNNTLMHPDIFFSSSDAYSSVQSNNNKNVNFLETFMDLSFEDSDDVEGKKSEIDEFLLAHEKSGTIYHYVNEDSFKDNNFAIVNGSVRINKYDDKMYNFWEDDNKKNTAGNLIKYGFLQCLINRLHDQHNFNVIIIDVGPTPTAINELAFMVSSHIMYVANPCPFSVASLEKYLEGLIPLYLKRRKLLCHEQNKITESLSRWKFVNKPPSMLPILINNFFVEKHNKNKTVICKSDSNMIRTIVKHVHCCKTTIKIMSLSDNVNSGLVVRLLPNSRVVKLCNELGRTIVEVTYEQYLDLYKKKNNKLLNRSAFEQVCKRLQDILLSYVDKLTEKCL